MTKALATLPLVGRFFTPPAYDEPMAEPAKLVGINLDRMVESTTENATTVAARICAIKDEILRLEAELSNTLVASEALAAALNVMKRPKSKPLARTNYPAPPPPLPPLKVPASNVLTGGFNDPTKPKDPPTVDSDGRKFPGLSDQLDAFAKGLGKEPKV